MNLGHVRAIADAVLYEGYVLYPYRASSVKNQQRWSFGGLLPRAHCEASGGIEPCAQSSEFLVEGGEDASLEACARFLHMAPRALEGARGGVWNEAVERAVDAGACTLGALASGPRVVRFSFEPDGQGEAVSGELELSAHEVERGVWRASACVRNESRVARDPSLQTLASTHVVVAVERGAMVSQLDPPEHLRAHAERCRNVGAWPVLVGAPGSRDTMLCSPIILYDHPAVAPESPGDLFDGTEIDEILTLRILTLTDDERREMAALDPRARALLERTLALSPDELARLHGARRSPFRAGDRVRVRPRARADALDALLAGRAATVVAVEHDYDGRVHVAVTLDDDPGHDLGADGKPGHRFFFAPDELERAGTGGGSLG